MLITHKIAPASRRAPRRSRGFGLLQVLLLISVVAGLAAMGYLQWRERAAMDSARLERQALSQADRAIVNYATVMQRLPCPDINRDGIEDCGAGHQKGWLPSVTLSIAGADPGVGVGQLRYLVQRGGGANDLTVGDDSWRPLEYDTTGMTFDAMRETPAAGDYQANIVTLADFCQRLDAGRKTAYDAGMAEVRSTPVRTVAYALVHPGNDDADGNGSLFDGVNASADPAVEDPIHRPLLAAYNDIVLERSYSSLLTAFHCQPLIDSINTVALAYDVVEQVDGLRADNIQSAQQAIVFAALAAGITAIEVTATVLEVISEVTNAAAAYATCAASLGLAVNACAAAPQHTAAAVLGGTVAGLNAVSVGLNITSAVMAGNALALADSTVDTTKLTCPKPDLTVAINAAKKEVTDAETERADIVSLLNTKRDELLAAETARTNAVNTLLYEIRRTHSSSDIDSRVPPLLDAAVTWESRSSAAQAAVKKRDIYQQAVDSWSAQVTNYATMLANRTTLLAQLDADIAALDLQIAATNDAAVKESLQKQRLEKTSQRVLLSDPVVLQKEHDKAVAELATTQANWTAAQNDLDAAQTALGTAQGSFQTAYDYLRNAGRYTIYSGGLPVAMGCTSTAAGVCQTDDIVTTSQIQGALNILFGASTLSPDPDAVYLKPIKIQKQITALEGQLVEADKRVVEAKKLLAQLNAQASPPPCNITGNGVTPMPPGTALNILIQVDQKGGTR
jgi:type II secretory pathway pseudopilin PulG